MSVSCRFACFRRSPILLVVGLWIFMGLLTRGWADEPLQFNRDIRPLLSDLCFQCHGPDKNQRKADLRLDQQAGAVGTPDHPGPIVPGKPDSSELLRRLTTNDPEERMPPPSTGRQLTPAQIERIRQWIAQGAPWQSHWAFLPIERPSVPAATPFSSLSPVDRFLQQALVRERLSPAESADAETLVRRVTLDLTGLPPTPEQVDEYLADRAPDRYERLVDRLLASPRWGERVATRWLDAARYADTSGYQNDGPRSMWRWRDWVLDAFNHDMPFDQFTIEQMAGDLLPRARVDQQIATGFHRNHRGNSEGGIIPEEFAVEYVIDRVETTGTVWLGLTIGCARCHEHKFDPISQREFYELYAYFNNIPEYGRAIKEGNSPPYIPAPTVLEEERLAQLTQVVAATQQRVAQLAPEVAARKKAWEEQLRTTIAAGGPTPQIQQPRWSLTDGLVLRLALDDAATATFPENSEKSANATSTAVPTSPANLDATFVPGRMERAFAPSGGKGEGDKAAEGKPLAVGDIAGFGYTDAFTLSAWIRPDSPGRGTIVSKMTDVPQGDGYCLQLVDGKLQFLLVKRWLDDALRVETREKITPDQWHHVAVVYDGSRAASGVTFYVDGQRLGLEVQLDALNQTITTKEPLRIGGGGGPQAVFAGAIDEVRIYQQALRATDVSILANADSIPEILAMPPEQRSPAAARKLDLYYVEQHAPAELRDTYAALVRARREQSQFAASISTVMVMQELPSPRPAFVLKRGEYDKPGEQVERNVPDSLGELPANAPNNRLGLAQWLVSTKNPLTARVAVNRLWQMVFGIGLVKTTEDFGSQGEPPSHPELLDWLASEFRDRQAWSVKRSVREMVTSGAYRQSSRATPDLLQKDPDNRLLARGPRFRLPAEMVRDQALAAGGLLVERIGGPSVKPYQPADLWKELATDSIYLQDHGEGLYRRSLYTYWKRTVAPPTMMTFDASGREACSVRDTRTNTPLQALTLLNEVTFVEAARALAQRVLTETLDDDSSRLVQTFRLVTGRKPQANELEVLRAGLAGHRERYRQDRAAAESLCAVGELALPGTLDRAEVAAWTAVASVLLNLDEVVNKH